MVADIPAMLAEIQSLTHQVRELEADLASLTWQALFNSGAAIIAVLMHLIFRMGR